MTARAGSSPAEQDRGNCVRSAGQWSPDRPTTSATVATRASWLGEVRAWLDIGLHHVAATMGLIPC